MSQIFLTKGGFATDMCYIILDISEGSFVAIYNQDMSQICTRNIQNFHLNIHSQMHGK